MALILTLGLAAIAALPTDSHMMYADDTALSDGSSKPHASRINVDHGAGELMDGLGGLGARSTVDSPPLDSIQLATILMQGSGLPPPEFMNQLLVETRRKKRSNYDNYQKHLVEIAPILHKKTNDGQTPLAIILAAPDLMNNHRKIRKKTKYKTKKIAKDNVNNGESHEIIENSKSDVLQSSVESSQENQANLANALANALQKYRNYKLRQEETEESIENNNETDKQNIEPLFINEDNNFHENNMSTSVGNHKILNSPNELILAESNENDKRTPLKGFKNLLIKEDWDNINHIILEEMDLNKPKEIKIKVNKQITDRNDKEVKQTNENKIYRELITMMSQDNDKKPFKEPNELQHFISGDQAHVNQETKVAQVNTKKIPNDEELSFELAQQIAITESSREKNIQFIEDEEKMENFVNHTENNIQKISDDEFTHDNGQDFILNTPLNNPVDDFVEKQLSSKETFINVGTYNSPFGESENLSTTVETRFKTYTDVIDKDQSILDVEISKKDDILSITHLEKLNHENELLGYVNTIENDAGESLINESKPEIHSIYANEYSFIVLSSKENMSNITKENILQLPRNVSYLEEVHENTTETVTFKSFNNYHKNIPIEEVITENNTEISSENSSNYYKPQTSNYDSSLVEKSKSATHTSNEINKIKTENKNTKESEISDSEETESLDTGKVSKEVHFVAIDELSKANLNSLRRMYGMGSLNQKIEGKTSDQDEATMQEPIENDLYKIKSKDRKGSSSKTFNLSFIFAK